MIKKMDALGRIVIPKSIRQQMALNASDPLVVEYDPKAKQIVLKRALHSCLICGKREELISISEDVFLCEECTNRIAPPCSQT